MAAKSPLPESRYQPLVIVAAALAAGIVLDRYGPLAAADSVPRTVAPSGAFASWWYAAACCLIAWWVLWRKRRPVTAAWLLLLAIALTGGAWHDLRWTEFSQQDIGRYASYELTPTSVEAVAESAPEIMPAQAPTPLRAIPGTERSRLALRMTGIRDGTTWKSIDGHAHLIADGQLVGIHAGDRLTVFAQLGRPLPPMNPGEFDFAGSARGDGRLASLRSESPECVTVVGRAGGGWLQRMLDAVRASGKQSLRRYVGPQRSGLAEAVLLGSRENLPSQEIMPFFLTGTVHLLVVSGFNVAILAAGLYGALRMGWVGRRTALAAIVAIVVAYTLVVGAEPSIMRSAVMVVLACVATWIGRRGTAFNLLAAAAIVVLAINPCELFQAGTQLSFLCVAVLFWYGGWLQLRDEAAKDPLDELIAASRPWPVRAARSMGWSAWMMTLISGVVWLASLPLVLTWFHVGSPVAVLISVLLWPVVSVAMWAGFLTLVFGWLAPPLAVAAGYVCSVTLGWMVGIVDWAEHVPAGHFWVPGPATWWVLGFYGGLLIVMLCGRAVLQPRWQVVLLSVWILLGLMPPIARAWSTRDELLCSFVAMGHGACVVFETPDGRTLLYDAGSLGSPEYATQSVADFLWDRGIMHIDGIILSHADIDHYNAVPGLLERFRVGAVYVSPVMFDSVGASDTSGPAVLHHAIEAAGVPIREVWSGDRLRFGSDLAMEVIHPPQQGVVGNDNANSVTVAAEFAGWRLLLPGDLESPGLEDVMKERPYDCDVLLAPHHGSRRSDPPGFAAWCTPDWVILSSGSDADAEVRRTYERAGHG